MKALPKTVSLDLFGFNSDSKTSKGNKAKKHFTAILYLAPDVEAFNITNLEISNQDIENFKKVLKTVCPWSSAGCRFSCLYTAGLGGVYPSVRIARMKKTHMFHNDKTKFFNLFNKDIEKFKVFCKKHNVQPTVRDDGTSDLGL